MPDDIGVLIHDDELPDWVYSFGMAEMYILFKVYPKYNQIRSISEFAEHNKIID